MLTITRHEVVKQGDIQKGLIVGITYKDDVTGREVYRDVRFSASNLPGNPPTKAEIRGRIKAWLINVPETVETLPDGTTNTILGKSILQMMKEQASIVPEISEDVKAKQSESLIGEAIQEQ